LETRGISLATGPAALAEFPVSTTPDSCGWTDIDRTTGVDFADFALFSENWAFTAD